MNSSICTLFEGDYHLGVGALYNSLCKSGFKGTCWVGYRGSLPTWANPICVHEYYHEFNLIQDIPIRFIKLNTTCHFTHYKPDFMLDIFNKFDKNCDALFYFDPDILVLAPWKMLEEWIKYGIALCEDILSPVPLYHPWRNGWRSFLSNEEISLKPRDTFYANGGFLGLKRKDIQFLYLWKKIQDRIWILLGSNNSIHLAGDGYISSDPNNYLYYFRRGDQDALNACIEASNNLTFSLLSKDCMIGSPGHSFLPHAIQQKKPWKRNYLYDALNGSPPLYVDKSFWDFTLNPLPVYTRYQIIIKKVLIRLASFIGRFYRRF